MKTSNLLLILATATIAISSCKKKEEPAPETPAGPTAPTSNYFVFDGTTYSYGPMAQGQGKVSDQFNFFSGDPNSDNEIRLFFKVDPTPGSLPVAGTYSVIPYVSYIADSTTCSIKVLKDTTNFISIGGGVITVGKSGSQTTYNFTALPLSSSKTVTGTFIY